MENARPLLSPALESLRAFAARPLVQLSGRPVQAINALQSSLDAHDSLGDGRRSAPRLDWAKAMGTALASEAKQEFHGNVCVAMEIEESNWVEEQKAVRAHGRDQWLGATPKTVSERKWLEDSDAAVLSSLVGAGYLTFAPRVVEVSDQMYVSSPAALMRPAQNSHVYMVSDVRGELQNFVPTPSGDMSAYARWFVLLHEVSHCEFHELANPFTPTAQSGLSPEGIQALNDWVFKPFNGDHRDHSTLLNECFADCYASMMLLEATGHAPAALEVILKVRDERASKRLDAESLMMSAEHFYTSSLNYPGIEDLDPDQRPDPWQRGRLENDHATDLAMDKMLAAHELWQGKSPATIKALALQYASDGFMEVFNPSRATPAGEPVGALLREGLQAPEVRGTGTPASQYASLTCAVAHACLQGDYAGGYAWMQNLLHGHPVREFVQDVWNAVRPGIEERMKTHPARFVDDFYAGQPVAEMLHAKVLEEIHSHFITTNPELPSLLAAEKARQQGQKVIADALMAATPLLLARAVPAQRQADSAESLGVGDWRARRFSLADSDMPAPARRAPDAV